MDSPLDQLLRVATPYESWRAPLAPGLRRTAAATSASLAGTLALLAHLAWLGEALWHPFWLLRPPEVVAALALAGALAGELSGLLGCWLMAFALLALPTRGYRRGAMVWQRAVFVLNLGGAGLSLPLALLVTLAAVNLAIWLVLISLALLGAALLVALAAAALGGPR